MADFWQPGAVTVLQRLRERPIEELEREIERTARRHKIVLLLPALYSEFEGAAMPAIVRELKHVHYLERVVLSLDRADADQFRDARERMRELPYEVKIVWHDGPGLQALYGELREAGFRLDHPGKGQSVWMALGYTLAAHDVHAIATHDCDIVNYSRELLARLVYPVVQPSLDFRFCKGYYARVHGKLYGRVTRLFYTPLIRALLRILGSNQFLAYLDNFRYALSGEFAVLADLARVMRISPTWGLEVSLLSEIYHSSAVGQICQVEITDNYEHKHQVISRERPDQGLVRMAGDIARSLFRVLSQDGIVMSEGFFRTLLTAYIHEARVAVEKYRSVSLINGLTYDRHEEDESVEVFVGALRGAIDAFIQDPVGIPTLPGWVRIAAAIPDFQERLDACVEKDNA